MGVPSIPSEARGRITGQHSLGGPRQPSFILPQRATRCRCLARLSRGRWARVIVGIFQLGRVGRDRRQRRHRRLSVPDQKYTKACFVPAGAIEPDKVVISPKLPQVLGAIQDEVDDVFGQERFAGH